MRFLRMLTNSLLAGALGAAFLTIVVLQLNPDVPLASATTWRLFLTLGLFYGVHLAVLFYLAMVGRELIGFTAFSPGWVSVRALAWLTAVAAAAGATLMWLNVEGFASTLGEAAVRRMTAGAAATAATAIVLLGLAGAHYSFGRRGSRVGAALLAIAVFGSLALPVAARGPGARASATPLPFDIAAAAVPVSGPRVVMLLLDGASLDYIWPRAAAGGLPNFARLLDSGASMDLATVRPTGPDPVWAAVATGMYPAKTGIRSPAAYFVRGDDQPFGLLPDHCFSHALVHLGLLRREPNTSASLEVRPLWSILAASGITAGIVRWPLTFPAPPVHGFVLSDGFDQLLDSVQELDASAAYPASALPLVRSAFVEGDDAGAPPPFAIGPAGSPEASAALRDRRYSRAMRLLRAEWPVQLSAVRYQGLDTVGHYNLRFTEPRDAGGASEEERRRRRQIVDRYYTGIDAEIGDALGALLPGDLLFVISGFGMERPNMGKRVLAGVLGDAMSGTHERAPDGFLLAYGTAVEPGRRQRGSIVDITPTVLYFLGLPVGRDMDGYARPDLFRAAFTTGRPIAYVPTHSR